MFGVLSMDVRRINAEELIDKLPCVDDLKEYELAIHLRAEKIGYEKGRRAAKQDILHRFQMTLFGHVL